MKFSRQQRIWCSTFTECLFERYKCVFGQKDFFCKLRTENWPFGLFVFRCQLLIFFAGKRQRREEPDDALEAWVRGKGSKEERERKKRMTLSWHIGWRQKKVSVLYDLSTNCKSEQGKMSSGKTISSKMVTKVFFPPPTAHLSSTLLSFTRMFLSRGEREKKGVKKSHGGEESRLKERFLSTRKLK